MAFNAALDREIASRDLDSLDGGKTALRVSAHSYNDGVPKIQVGRIVYFQNGNVGHRKVGRMTLEESLAVANVIPEIANQIA